MATQHVDTDLRKRAEARAQANWLPFGVSREEFSAEWNAQVQRMRCGETRLTEEEIAQGISTKLHTSEQLAYFRTVVALTLRRQSDESK